MYQALYRKYRPASFSEVVGQEHITETLKGELAGNKIFHAYLFTGTRGTGKTTCAKILAKAVNCENPKNGDPCGECASCKAIANGDVMDIVEIDAASNNGVDDVRVLREQIVFTPANAKYRVYIIDEVHMLSKAAFNALLKTLEEPPSHVIFILATTEVQELPATILSRCQRFDFSRIDASVIKERLLYVAKCEAIDLSDGAASLIASLSDGCMRDALSLLDQCAGSGALIDEKAVENACGMTGHEHINNMAEYIAKGDSGACLSLMDKLYCASVDIKRLCSDLISHYRNLMIIKSVNNGHKLVLCSDLQMKTYKVQASAIDLSDILYNLDVLQSSLLKLKGPTARCEMEMALVRLCTPQLKGDIASLEKRIAALENGSPKKAETAINKKPVIEKPAPVFIPPAEPEPMPEPIENPIASDIEPSSEDIPLPDDAPCPEQDEPVPSGDDFSWNAVLSQLMRNSQPLYGLLSGSSASLVGDSVEIHTPNTLFWDMINGNADNKQRVENAVFAATGKHLSIKKAGGQTSNTVDPLLAFSQKFKNLNEQEK